MVFTVDAFLVSVAQPVLVRPWGVSVVFAAAFAVVFVVVFAVFLALAGVVLGVGAAFFVVAF
ncbi:hypothetical protein [Intrasporangium oryzae]|uniref:hypothetical protein n=1 Tax=Intrasporangium oryzae TaxID=412687 RepID=UPI0006866D9A|nr:hypothetical protein [Intrasporangium oryzae]